MSNFGCRQFLYLVLINVSQKSFYHTSMLIQMVGKPHNCTSFKGHFLENGLNVTMSQMVHHHVNRIFWKIVHDFSIRDTTQTTQWNNPLAFTIRFFCQEWYETNCTDTFSKFCIMLAWVPEGLFLSCLSRKSLNGGNAGKFLVFIHPCHRYCILQNVHTLFSIKNKESDNYVMRLRL